MNVYILSCGKHGDDPTWLGAFKYVLDAMTYFETCSAYRWPDESWGDWNYSLDNATYWREAGEYFMQITKMKIPWKF